MVYTVLFLKADMNRDDLVGPNQQYHQNYLAFEKEFPQPDDIVVVVESLRSAEDMRDLFRQEVKPRLAKHREVGAYNQEI